MNNLYNFKTFIEIFPDYETCKNWFQSTGLNYQENEPKEWTYNLIKNEYFTSHVACSEESFKNRFANVLFTYLKEFENSRLIIDELHSLTDNDISIDYENITNIALTPETENTTNAESVNFISQQQKNISKKGKLQIKKELLSNKKIYPVQTFLNRFRHLFIRIISPSYNTLFYESDNE